jgi:hypothetical protein
MVVRAMPILRLGRAGATVRRPRHRPPPRPSPVTGAGSDPPVVGSTAPSRKRCRSSLRRSSAWPVEAAPSPKRHRVRLPHARPLPMPVKTGSTSCAARPVCGRSSTTAHRGCLRGRQLHCQAWLLAFAGAPCAPTPSSLKAYNATADYESHPVRSGRCFTRLQLPAVKVAAVAKVVATPSVVINIVLVVPPFMTDQGATDGGDQAVRGPAPSGLASPQNPSLQCCLLLLLCPLRRGGSLPMAFEDACPELFDEDSLPVPEIRLRIAINVVSHLNATEEFRSLSTEELSLREFILDQMLLL